MAKVIVFGPTGNIASVAAVTAQKHGAQVYLAMRDPAKTIPGLTKQEEEAGGFVRVQADLTKPDTIAAAIKSSGATRAFIYSAHGSPDFMKSSLEALKAAGVTFVVFLSSYTIQDRALRDVPQEDFISFIHAQVELSLDAVYGPGNYVAVRPGGFATNLLRFREGIAAGTLPLFGQQFSLDCITPGDMGRVSGTILAEGRARDGQDKVFLYGPAVHTHLECIDIIGDVLGKKVEVTDMTAQEATEQYLALGMPPPVVEYMVRILGGPVTGDAARRAFYDTGVANVQLYTGRPSTGLREWVAENKHLFAA